MRRTLAVLLLLATSWPHVVVLECALGSPPQPTEEASHDAPGADQGAAGAPHHAGHHGDARPGDAHHVDVHHAPAHRGGDHEHARSAAGSSAGGLQCTMVMACGLAMIQSVSGAAVADARTASREAFRPALEAPAATVLAADPPPPRRHA